GRGPLTAHANPDRIPGLHRVLDRERDVREGPVHVPHGVPDVGDRIRAAPGRAELVVQEFGRAELVGDGAVTGGEALVEYPLHHRVRGRAGLAGSGHLILPKFSSEVTSNEQRHCRMYSVGLSSWRNRLDKTHGSYEPRFIRNTIGSNL